MDYTRYNVTDFKDVRTEAKRGNDAALPTFCTQTGSQLAPRGAPMLQTFPMMMTQQGLMPAMMCPAGAYSEAVDGKQLTSPQGKVAPGTLKRSVSANATCGGAPQQPAHMTVMPAAQQLQQMFTAAPLGAQTAGQNGTNAAASARPTMSFRFQPNQWGMVPTTLPNGQLAYVMLPLSHIRAAAQAQTHAKAETGAAAAKLSATKAHLAPTSDKAGLSLAAAKPPQLKALHVPPAVLGDKYGLSRQPSVVSTTLSPVKAAGGEALPSNVPPTAAAPEPAISGLDEWGDADMLRVFLGQDDGPQSWPSAMHDGCMEVDDLFVPFDDPQDDLTFHDDLNLSSCTWSQLDVDDPVPPHEHSADSLRTMVPFYSEDDSSASISMSGVALERCEPLRSKWRTGALKSNSAALKPRGGMFKVTRADSPDSCSMKDASDIEHELAFI